MEVILSEKYKINWLKNIPYNKDELIRDILLNNDASKHLYDAPDKHAPGIQSDIYIETPQFKNLNNFIFQKFCEIYDYDKNLPYGLKLWTYISTAKNIHSGYHTHLDNLVLLDNNHYTWVFYIQMPNNLKNDDGKIFFQTEDGIEHKFLPEEGDLIFFPADLPHRPELNQDSNIDRIVLAGNYCILDYNKKYRKKTKTIL